MATRLVVGLGNPGPRYAPTRHNAGFMVVDAFAERHGVRVDRSGWRSLLAEMRLGDTRVVLMKPQTFMNLSGEAVAPALRWYRCALQDLIVIYDDLDLPLGRLRLRRAGSSGGHNGVRSLIEHLGSDQFPRIRLGIGRPPAGWSVPDWVLSPFTPEEEPVFRDAVARAAEAVEVALRLGFAAAMNRFNQ